MDTDTTLKTPKSKSPENETYASYNNTIDLNSNVPGQIRVIKRNGKVTSYDDTKITMAMTKAFLAVEGNQAANSQRIHETVAALATHISQNFSRRMPTGGTIHIEDIQDQVELMLMRNGDHKVARAYVIYREERRKAREVEKEGDEGEGGTDAGGLHITLPNGTVKRLDIKALQKTIKDACQKLSDVNPDVILNDTLRNIFDGIPLKEVNKALQLSARALIEKEPNYSYVAARLLLNELNNEALNFLGLPDQVSQNEMSEVYSQYFKHYIERGVTLELIDPKLKTFDLELLGKQLSAQNDLQFTYLGLQTLYDRYFIHSQGIRFELPQAFFMRVAMGLAIARKRKRGTCN